MKLFHNKFVGKALAVLFGLAAAGYFAWTFSYFGAWVGSTFLDQTLPGAAITLTIFCAIVMALAMLYAFFYIEYAREDVEAYEDEQGDGSFIKSFHQLKRGVLFLELFSLLFRFIQLAYTLGNMALHIALGLAMIGVGLALLWLAHHFGKVLHAQVNAPHDVVADRMKNEAGHQLWRGAPKLMKRMSADQLKRLADGDETTLDEVRDMDDAERQGALTNAEKRRVDRQTRREQSRAMASHYLKPRRKPDDPADFLASHNGKHPNSTGNFR